MILSGKIYIWQAVITCQNHTLLAKAHNVWF